MRSKRTKNRFKELLKSRFFVILAAVAVFLTVLPVALGMMGRADIVRSGVNAVAYPFRELSRLTGSAFRGFSDYFTEFERLKSENEQLKNELADAKEKIDSAEAAKAENEWLRGFILFSVENPEFDLIDAVAVSRDSGELVTYFNINKGSASGIAVGMPVMSDAGLVGYVYEVGVNYSKVRSIICDDTSAGAVCPRSAAHGIIEGNYGFLSDGLCKLICPDGNADIKIGDIVVTSGTGSVYPYGLPIGRVASVEINEYTRELIAYIEPYHDFKVADRVMVIGADD